MLPPPAITALNQHTGGGAARRRIRHPLQLSCRRSSETLRRQPTAASPKRNIISKKNIIVQVTQNHIKEYCKTALAKGYLSMEEHVQISEWLPSHLLYEAHWELCYHVRTDRAGRRGLCVFGDGKHWPASYLKFKVNPEAVKRQNLMQACRRAIEPSRNAFMADYPEGWEADHANPGGFKAIMDGFVSDYGMPNVEYSLECCGWCLDPETAAAFREYHDERVEWRALTPEEHRQITQERKQGSA